MSPTPTTAQDRPTAEDLLHREHYTPEEAACLLGIRVSTIRRAARTGALPAAIVDHRVLCIRRDDILRWLSERG